MKQNCWEFIKCGREIGGSKAHEFGVCPTATEKKADSVHDGKNGGRCCWAISGTLCGNKVQGTYAMKEHDCLKCDFYRSVKKEEGNKFMYVVTIIEKLK